ncbi:hypothetical protein RFI_05414 [Reticulomyxa filosa]|uniref:Uncharacterized protein n=1 Tax=Reticulomyxa filosa TaxID=46433 RepID=X6P0P8_RETFI|nr:hypothetical protein RFI_05414 [Reticulomyxa filosa]|eukprot:ETO31708.1 hypothetical protein RFI_05414 [Reticulomyxa filosa]
MAKMDNSNETSIDSEQVFGKLFGKLSEELQNVGLDIIEQFPMRDYNKYPKIEQNSLQIKKLPEKFRNISDMSDSTGILIGNSRHLWKPFLKYFQTHPDLQSIEHPLDVYVTQMVRQCCDHVLNNDLKKDRIGFEIYYSYEMSKDRLISFQTVAHVSKNSFFYNTPHLCLHPIYGPWIAFRALVLLDHKYQDNNLKDVKSVARFEDLNQMLSNNLLSKDLTLETIDKQIQEKMNLALNCNNPKSDVNCVGNKRKWKLWLNVRDECSKYFKWHAHRYDQSQLLYHYTGDKKYLFTS